MARRFLIYCFSMLLVYLSPAQNSAQNKKVESYSPRLQSITSNYWKDFTRLNPLFATENGIRDYNDLLEIPISNTYINQAIELNRNYLDSLESINVQKLNQHDWLTAGLLKYILERDLEGLELGMFFSSSIERPVDQFVFSFPTRFATMASGAGAIPFKTVKDYENFILRMKAFPEWINVAIKNMNQGIRKGNVAPKSLMQKVPAQLRAHFKGSVESSVFYKPVVTMPDDISTADKARIRREYTSVINNYIRPAYKKLHDYFITTYIPKARSTTGLVYLPGGKKEYQYWIKYWTTTSMSPNQIFQLGLSEVTRIRKEMDSIKLLTGFRGNLKSFFNYVRTDQRFFPFKSEEEVLRRFRSFEVQMKPAIQRLFNLLPKASFEVRATEKFRQEGANAQYMKPSRDGSLPGVFYEVIPDASRYNYHGMETLFLHEAIPGHHFQLALQQEMDIPEFQKSSFLGAYTEGWALYAETLGKELGMFKDPYQYLGRLGADMERSVRLVVDIGMHHKGWSREKAIQYVLENQPFTQEVAEQRIERHIVTPGQGLSYKIGEQKIFSLKKYAEDKLGGAFNIREFHDEILKDGALPLSILEEKIMRWVADKTRVTTTHKEDAGKNQG